jgi:YggT family protein
LEGLIVLIQMIFYLYQLLLLGRILLSWVQVDPYHPVVQFLYTVTEPVVRPIRDLLPPTGMVDFSPFVAIILAQLLQMLLVQIVRTVF